MHEQHEFGVIVVGGGLAGVCAAIAAARECRRLGLTEQRIGLIQDRPMLGGNASSEIRVMPSGAGDDHPWAYETGIIHEILLEERVRNHTHWDGGTTNSVWDLTLWESVRAEPNITLYLNASVRTVTMEDAAPGDPPAIAGIVACQLGNERQLAISGHLFVDATGDGTIGALAGADYRIGREPAAEFGESFAPADGDAACMGSSILFRARDTGRPVPFEPPPYAARYPSEESLHQRPHANFRNGYWWVEVGFPYDTVADNEDIRDRLLPHVLGAWDHVKNHCPGLREQATTWALDWFGWLPGKRESRRLMGDYILTENDVRQGTLHQDRVAYGGRFIDLHTIGGILAGDQPGNPVDVSPELWDRMRVHPYPIPLRSLYSRNIANLFMAGRDISTSHVGMGSPRVMLTCAVGGQAVGMAAAQCLHQGRRPRDVASTSVTAVQQSLLRQGCYIPRLANADPADLARLATVAASSSAPLMLEPELDSAGRPGWPGRRRALETALAVLIPVSERRLRSASLWLEHEGAAPVTVSVGLRPARDIWDFSATADIAGAQAVVTPGQCGWVRFDLDAAIEPHQLYWLHTDALGHPAQALFWRYLVDPPTATVSAWQRPSSGHWNYLLKKNRIDPLVEGFAVLCTRLEPPSMPYAAGNVLSGVTRPETWTNAWVSDPQQALPQWLELRWPQALAFNQVELTFDTNLNRTNEITPPYARHSECVRDYELQAWYGGAWHTVAHVAGNYQRRRVHHFPEVTAGALRLVALVTNGDLSARLYEIRVYREAVSS